MKIDVDQLQALIRREDWVSAYMMLDEARAATVTIEDERREVYWRSTALEKQGNHEEALSLLRDNARLFNSQSLVQHRIACLLLRLGRDREAVVELSKAPFDLEIDLYYGLAIDAKFFYYYLLAKQGDALVEHRLSEIPDNYQHITMDGDFLTKPDILALTSGRKVLL